MCAKNQKSILFKQLDEVCNVLRKTMDSSEYRNYILGFIFYKFLSKKQENYFNEEFKNDNISYDQITEQSPEYEDIRPDIEEQLGYFIEKKYDFQHWVNLIKEEKPVLEVIEKSLRAVEESAIASPSEDDFKGLFSDINLASTKLGNSESAREKNIAKVILKLNDIDFSVEEAKIDILGDAYEYLIANFASQAGKKSGEFYTPQEVSTILAKIVTSKNAYLESAYDPACGSGSLLLQVAKNTDVGCLYGQEIKETTFNLARMNMFLHGKKYHEFNIKKEDTIMDPQHKYDDKGLERRFDAIVANPPFSLKWDAPEDMLSDPRFAEFGTLAPKSKMDYAFIQHMLYYLSNNGIMASVVPHGVLFRGGAEGKIREFIIKNRNWLDAVIGIPANVFFGTSIPACILVFRKNRAANEKVLFIEASREFTKGKNQNILTKENIDKIVSTYKNRNEIDKYSKNVSLEEIAANEYNLNITRYVDTFEEEVPIDIEAVNKELKEVNLEIEKTEKEIQAMIAEIKESK